MAPIRIYIDHWEDYESIGDKAMLLNAMRRLELHLGNCLFVSPFTSEKPESFLLPNMVPVQPPYKELERTVSLLKRFMSKIFRFLPSKYSSSKTNKIFYLNLAIIFFNIKLFLYSIGFRNVFTKPFQNFLKEIKNCDVFFAVGDCSLSDYWLEGVILKSWLLKLVRPFVKVSVMSSQGIGPLNTDWACKKLVKSLKTLDILTYRDYSNSKNLVDSGGLTGVLTNIVADEAFSFPIATNSEIWNELNRYELFENTPFIIVNFRNTDFTQSTTHLLEKIATLLDEVVAKTDKNIVFICMSRGNDYGQDYQAGEKLKDMMVKKNRFYLLEPIDDIELVKGVIGKAVYSMGISYHLHVFSLSQGNPTLILYTGDYYKTKSEGLISFYNPPNRAVNISETENEINLKYILEIDNNLSSIKIQNLEVNKRILEDNDWTIRSLKTILENKSLRISEETN